MIKLVVKGAAVQMPCDQNCQFLAILSQNRIRVILLGSIDFQVKDIDTRDIVGYRFEDGNTSFTHFTSLSDRMPKLPIKMTTITMEDGREAEISREGDDAVLIIKGELPIKINNKMLKALKRILS